MTQSDPLFSADTPTLQPLGRLWADGCELQPHWNLPQFKDSASLKVNPSAMQSQLLRTKTKWVNTEEF